MSSEKLSIDHVVILVDDLERAASDYRALGFSVVEGGRHADGVTQNVLIAFEDGSYLELVAFLDSPPPEHLFARGDELGEGLLAYALLPANIEATISRARHNGLHMRGPLDGGRLRPDGVSISWRTGRAEGADLPFLCADVTPRGLRVPHGPSARHPNGARSIAEVAVAIGKMENSRRRYAGLLGQEGTSEPNGRGVIFGLGKSIIRLVDGTDKEVESYLQERGEGPYALVLAGEQSEDGELASTLTHGVRLTLEQRS